MFILPRRKLPQQPQELAAALEEGLRQFVSSSRNIVRIDGGDLQALERIAIDLSEAQVEAVQQPVRVGAKQSEPALFTRNLTLSAKPLRVYGSEMYLDFRANDVHLNQAPLGNGTLVLLVHRAASGDLKVETE